MYLSIIYFYGTFGCFVSFLFGTFGCLVSFLFVALTQICRTVCLRCVLEGQKRKKKGLRTQTFQILGLKKIKILSNFYIFELKFDQNLGIKLRSYFTAIALRCHTIQCYWNVVSLKSLIHFNLKCSDAAVTRSRDAIHVSAALQCNCSVV